MKPETKKKIIKLIIIVALLALICLAVYLPLKLTGTIDKINSAEKMKEVILSGGAYSYFIYFTIQFLQVTFLPLPAFVTTVPGVWVFGPWVAFALSFVAIMCGTIFAFYLGRKIGKPIINWIVGQKEAEKWNEKLSKGKFVFFLMMLFPCFPDDILCLLVGATNMSFKFFLVTNLISRPIGIACTCFLGSGFLIPFSGWGIPVWILLIALMALAFIISWRYQKQIENFVTNLGAKISRKKEPKIVSNETEQPLTENVITENNDVAVVDNNKESAELNNIETEVTLNIETNAKNDLNVNKVKLEKDTEQNKPKKVKKSNKKTTN